MKKGEEDGEEAGAEVDEDIRATAGIASLRLVSIHTMELDVLVERRAATA